MQTTRCPTPPWPCYGCTSNGTTSASTIQTGKRTESCAGRVDGGSSSFALGRESRYRFTKEGRDMAIDLSIPVPSPAGSLAPGE